MKNEFEKKCVLFDLAPGLNIYNFMEMTLQRNEIKICLGV